MTDPVGVLAPEGALARAIPHYEDRAEQRVVAAAVAEALRAQRPLIVEAGTGTGKTLAYLLPALASGKRVVVSTGTKALQDQIARHDLPLLRELLPTSFTAVVLKGTNNYLCRRRLADAQATVGDPAVREHLSQLATWAVETSTGDRAEVEFLGEDAPIWATVTTTPDGRLGARCPYFERCFVTQARRAADTAQLVLVNHHLYFADLSLRASSPGARVLPEHDAVIFDEAHQLEDVVTEHFGARLSTQRLSQLVRDAHSVLAAQPLLERRDAAGERIGAVERSGTGLFAMVRRVVLERGGADGTRVTLPADAFTQGDLQALWFRTDAALEELARLADDEFDDVPASEADPQDDGVRHAARVLARRCREFRDDLAGIAEQDRTGMVYCGEARATGVALTAMPIGVADVMRRHVVRAPPTPIFTSATLTADASFAYTRTRLGLTEDEVDELAVASPFDYARQAMLYVPRDLPVPGEPAFAAASVARARELLALTDGHAFFLFTSHRALTAAATLLQADGYPLLVQGTSPRASLIDQFRATPRAVLLGTASFWEGVDVPGDALRLVIIDRLPFAVHTDPLIAARMEQAARLGDDPFVHVQLPAAAIALKQGFGRLIRRRDDRGIVAILDPRMVTKAYGRVFLRSLPADLPRTSALEQVARWWRGPQPLPGVVGER